MTIAPTPVEIIAPPADITANHEVTKQIRGSSLLVLGRLSSLATNLVVQVLLVRTLTKNDFGAFSYVLSLVTTGATLCTFGLDRGLTRFLAMYEERGDRAKFWGTIVLQTATIAGVGLAFTAVAVGLRSWVGGTLLDDQRLATVLAIMVLLAPIQALDNMAAAIFSVFTESKAIFVRRYVLAPILRLAIVALLVMGGFGLYFVAAGYVFAGLFGLLLYGSMMRRLFKDKGLLAGGVGRAASPLSFPIREITAFTIPLLATDAMFVVLNTSDVVILRRTAGVAAISSYRAVLPVARLGQLVMNSFSLLFAPLMARLWTRGDRRLLCDAYWQTAAWVAVLSFPLFAVTLGMAGPLTVILFGHRYADAAPYLTILSVAFYFNASLGFNGVTLKMVGRVWLSAATALAALVFNITANLILIPRYGAAGAAWGMALSVAFYNVLKQLALRRGSGIVLLDRRYQWLYLSIAGSTAALLAVQAMGAPVVVRIAVIAATILTVLGIGRRLLLVGEMFPEFARVPFVGRLLVSRERKA